MKCLPCVLLFVNVVSFSCSRDNAKALPISEDLFVNLYADMMIAREEGILLRADSLQTNHRLDSLYTSYRVTAEQVEAVREYYKRDINRWKQLYEKVTKRLETLQQKPVPPIGK